MVRTRVNDVFYECNGNGDCATRARPIQGQQWGLEAVQAPQAWSIQKGSKAVKVGAVTTGAAAAVSRVQGQQPSLRLCSLVAGLCSCFLQPSPSRLPLCGPDTEQTMQHAEVTELRTCRAPCCKC